MPDVDLNYWAILVAGASAMVVGALWYAMPVFGRTWMTMVGKTEDDLKRGVGTAYSGMFILALVLAFILAHFLQFADATTLGQGLTTALWVWLGFVVTTKGADYLFAHKPLKLYLIDVGYHLVEILVMSAILVSWT
jgi:hypothetical protein